MIRLTLSRPFSRDDGLQRLLLALACLLFLLALVLPLGQILQTALFDEQGNFAGLDNLRRYLLTPSLLYSLTNTLTMGVLVTFIVTGLAFIYAYAITRTRMPGRGLFKVLAMMPILAPSLLPAISLVYLFGNQGMLRHWLLGESIYGPIGIVLGLSFWAFPHAVMLLSTAMGATDGRLFEACRVLRGGPVRAFFQVTLPGIKYALLSTLMVVFTMVITDFGVPKVIGGQYPVLATDIYKQVVGQQNFAMGALISTLLLLPALLAFLADGWLQRRNKSLIDSRSQPYHPAPNRWRDGLLLGYCSLIALALLAVIGMAAYASVVQFWPYNLSLTLNHYGFDLIDGWQAYGNSLKLAGMTALFGTLCIFLTAYLVEKGQGQSGWRKLLHGLAMIPLAVPGLVLGLAYIFFFNRPDNPLNLLYGGMTLLVVSTVMHFYTVGHLTAITALKQLPAEIEAIAASLKVSRFKAMLRVSLPMCLPAVLDVAIYLFVNAMTTVSAVVFLYGPDTMLASIAVLNLDDSGNIAPAAAMAMLIFITALIARLLHMAASHGLLRLTQSWRQTT
ncbi:iron(III) transport system permease protein [Oceanisphaera litoralis]|uniref:putative 2-aminoethylphosphonate ABC transporter permease subunit n=1 Tax=Oceanisphaera litoralis TaxID=225144 RepID=UPI001956EBFB|nr:putative 2-aminoethylphosphonate ABC transporter permease subunit [Oceanisphaera litoralis]MBM7457192.1 iron(III) transport system permease protein [Oceanisphaera litoralis]